ncbi:MAG: hypothetical protein KAH91_01295 [Thermoplasmatales archaeon]|nr:hypothetical protein [Thermoplasmatales archaeon]
MVPVYYLPRFVQKILRRIIITYQYIYAFFIPIFKKKNSPLVFCIGDGKTATTSLSKALGIMGYRSVHYLRMGYCPKIGWIEFIRKSNYDTFADWPMMKGDFYKELDKEFPNSKFILTLRDPQSYGKSFEKFFKKTVWEIKNPEQLKKEIKRFENRNNEIINYFKDRPSQLLVIDIFKGVEWSELCNFLDKPIPKKPFPHKNKWSYTKKEKKE